MKSSIVITNYNKGRYIEECILSAINQIKKDNQIIVLDNNSEDSSLEIINKYKNKVEFYKKKRISNYGAVNQIDLIKFSLKYIKGDIIHFLDSDDFFDKKKVFKISNYFSENAVDVIFDIPKCKGKKIYKFKLKNKNNLIWPTIIPTSSISIKKNFLTKIFDSDFFDGFPMLEIDFRINVVSRMFKKNFLLIDKGLNIYRVTPDGIMSKYRKYSFLWWKKRMQAHLFLKKAFLNNKLKFKETVDYKLTKLINMFIKRFVSFN